MRTWLLTPLIFLSLHAPVHACTWEGLSPQSVEQRLPPMIVQADRVIRGRVVSVGNDGLSARIEILHAFKGAKGTLNAASSLLCGHIFQVGEEMIYFVHGVAISSPRAMPVSEWLLASLQKATSPAR
jgi:hypothetical protein